MRLPLLLIILLVKIELMMPKVYSVVEFVGIEKFIKPLKLIKPISLSSKDTLSKVVFVVEGIS